MPRALGYAGLALVVSFGLLWALGALDGLAGWLQDVQRAAQDRLAGAIRALRGGEPGALAAFWALCFGYGVVHAAGPGHGKLVIGGYGLARRVPVARLAGLALASSLAQAAVAVALVYALVAMLGLARGAVEGAAEAWLTPAGHMMIAGLGLWLVWRGVRGLARQAAAPVLAGATGGAGHHGHGHAHDHHHHPHDDHADGQGPGSCARCGHAHGPTLEQVERVVGFRDGLALVAGIALRPCAGALFVLILTWQLGIALAGVAGAFIMAAGTALVTVGTAALSVWAREGAFAALPGDRMARVLPLVEVTLGAALAAAAFGLFLQAL
jgi:ABC-type nickel/cobalt efflux system permease component RcnA